MKKIVTILTALAPLVWACGGSFPVPTQRLADAQSAERSATELGANSEPGAQLHLKLAQEQIGQAQAAMKADDNQKADSLLIRAKADAELALALAKEKNAKTEAEKAATDLASQTTVNTAQGAKK